jgi:hypothetical protein
MVQFCTYRKVVRTYSYPKYSTYVRTCTEKCITTGVKQYHHHHHQRRCGNCGETGHYAKTCKKDVEGSSQSDSECIIVHS